MTASCAKAGADVVSRAIESSRARMISPVRGVGSAPALPQRMRAANCLGRHRAQPASVGPVDIVLPVLPRRVQRHIDAYGTFDKARPDRFRHALVLRLDHRAEFGDALRIARGEIMA